MAVGRSQIRAVRWMRQDSPCSFVMACRVCRLVCGLALSWWRSTLSHLYGGKTVRKRFFRVSTWTSELINWPLGNTSLRITPSQSQKTVGPSAVDQTHCPVVVLTMPIAFPNGWTYFYPPPCLHRRLLSVCEYLWLIRFLPKETQLLLSVYNARRSQTPFWKFPTSLLSSGKPCNYVHKRGKLKSCRMQTSRHVASRRAVTVSTAVSATKEHRSVPEEQNISFIQQDWAEKINVLHYFLPPPPSYYILASNRFLLCVNLKNNYGFDICCRALLCAFQSLVHSVSACHRAPNYSRTFFP
jgi:hypothetical protein